MQILYILPLIALTINVELPLTLGQATCAALMSSFDVIYLSFSPYLSILAFLRFRGMSRRKASRLLSRRLSRRRSCFSEYPHPMRLSGKASPFSRVTTSIIPDIIHEICISYDSNRDFDASKEQIVFIGFTQT